VGRANRRSAGAGSRRHVICDILAAARFVLAMGRGVAVRGAVSSLPWQTAQDCCRCAPKAAPSHIAVRSEGNRPSDQS
jgi:hypothetical protein